MPKRGPEGGPGPQPVPESVEKDVGKAQERAKEVNETIDYNSFYRVLKPEDASDFDSKFFELSGVSKQKMRKMEETDEKVTGLLRKSDVIELSDQLRNELAKNDWSSWADRLGIDLEDHRPIRPQENEVNWEKEGKIKHSFATGHEGLRVELTYDESDLKADGPNAVPTRVQFAVDVAG